MAPAMTTPDDALSTTEPAPQGSAVTRAGERPVDVLILTALPAELEAVLALGEGWSERKDLGGFPCHRRDFPRADGKSPLVVVAAWLGKMGQVNAAIRGGALLRELRPVCVAMCGICAGMRGEVALGDVIVADRLYSYDEGKLVAEPGREAELHHDIETYSLHPLLKMGAAGLKREIDLRALEQVRPPSKASQRRWLLHALYAHEVEGGPAPMTHEGQERECPDWTDRLDEAEKEGLLELRAGALSLTAAGRELVLNERTRFRGKLPKDPELQIHVGAVGTGKAVQKDPALFTRLRRVMRTTLGVEMEGAAIGELARHFDTRGIVVKAVSDHGDLQKDDSFRAFACRASAEVLLALLLKYIEPAPAPDQMPQGDEGGDEDDGRSGTFKHHDAPDREGGFLARVERVALLRDPGATVTRHRAQAPFAGVLEIAVKDGNLIDLRILAAIDQSITEELITRYQADVERPFRQQDPLLRSTLIHAGSPAPAELAQAAARRGVVLKSFGEYQRLFDFAPYLVKQTRRLDVDPVYPPWLYVEQPARWSLAGGREEEATERALETLWDMLEAPHPRFALVLGDFGAGKTFLLHELARRMDRDKHPVVPVLVEMSKLEKQPTLKALLAQHFANADVGRIDLDAFQYLLAEGRVALLFDGFDELALRLTYDRALEHFETVMAAAQGNAKVVVTSRTQHFLTEQQIRRALAEKAEQVPGYRLVQLEKFGEEQIRRFLGNLIKSPEEAEERYRLLDEVKDLLGLSRNPRMLGFIAKIEPEKLREAKERSGKITAAKLYEILIGQWLDFEFERVNPPGAPKGISRATLQELVTKLACVFWERNAKELALGEFREMLVAEGVEPAVVEHMIGSGSLLVRDTEGRFSFVHRSVMEWLVAEIAAREVMEKGDAAVLGVDEMSELMADFFLSLAGREQAEAWASRALHGGTEGHGKKNGLRIMRRASASGDDEVIGDDEIEVVDGINLAGQDLRGRNLSGSDLRKANLTQANLWSATLVQAKLAGALLISAQLGRADLSGADLSGADLSGADLSFARLVGANLRGASLHMTRLRGAKLVGAEGVEVEELAAIGAAPPVLGDVAPMWVPASECHAVAWSPSGDLMASGHKDGAVRFWDTISGKAIRTLTGHTDTILSVAFSPDGSTLASGADDKSVRLWDVATARTLRVLEGHTDSVQSVAFSPDGSALASGSCDRTVRIWDVATARAVRSFYGHTGLVQSVAFSPDGSTLASGSIDRTVRIWDVATARAVRTFEGHKSWVMSVAFSPDGSTLASGADDKTVRLWDVATARALRVFEGHLGSVLSVAFSLDGTTLVSGSGDSTVRLWDVATARALRAFKGHTSLVQSVAFSPDDSMLVSGSDDSTVRVWDVATARALRAFGGHSDWVQSVAFSPDGATLASGSYDGTVRLWDIATARALRVFKGHAGWVLSAAFSPDGTTLASGSYDSTVRLWDVATARALRVFEGHTSFVQSVAFSPDGSTLASASNDNTVRLWDVATARVLRVLEGHTDWVQSVAFSPDGSTLASGSGDRTVRLWDVATARALYVFKGHIRLVQSVAFSPDGSTLASGSIDRTVRLWDIATARALRVFKGHAGLGQSVAFSPDGTTLAFGSHDSTVRLLDVTAGTLRAFRGHTSSVQSVMFSPDGATLASGSHDSTVRLWDVATARCLAILLATPEGWAAFTPDGRYKLGGDIAGSFWHVIGLCRFEPGELDAYLPHLRVADGDPFIP
jgi:WD40 repeat protein/nucleoside phosphorylase